jgi:hypothetical protein
MVKAVNGEGWRDQVPASRADFLHLKWIHILSKDRNLLVEAQPDLDIHGLDR